jgi:glycosyltransferase involved in cell wall biosynthesis
MRLAIVNITAGGMSGGYRKYLSNMLPRLSANSKIEKVMCAYPSGMDVRLWVKPHLNIHYCEFKPSQSGYLLKRSRHELRNYLDSFSPDIIFLPGARYFGYKSVPVVNMLQNMEPFVSMMPGDALRDSIKKYLQKRIGINAIRKVEHTIAISLFVREFITNVVGKGSDRISTIYHGLANKDGVTEAKKPSQLPGALGEQFLFTAGSIRPARGLEDLIQALAVLKGRGHKLRLFIAGDLSPYSGRYRSKLQKKLATSGLADDVHWGGYLNNEEMRWCYQKCTVFVMTSRVEACPNIALEALSYGALIVSSDNPPLPEIFSHCASYYQAFNGTSLAEKIISLLNISSIERRQAVDRAQERSARFSWDLTANETVSVFEGVVAAARKTIRSANPPN